MKTAKREARITWRPRGKVEGPRNDRGPRRQNERVHFAPPPPMGRGLMRMRVNMLRALSRCAHTSTATQRFPELRRFYTRRLARFRARRFGSHARQRHATEEVTRHQMLSCP